MTDPIIEAAARALESLDDDSCGLDYCADWYQDKLRQKATAVLAAVTPLIRAAALEEAAQVAEEQTYYPDTNIGMRQQWVKDQIAAKVHALKDKP